MKRRGKHLPRLRNVKKPRVRLDAVGMGAASRQESIADLPGGFLLRHPFHERDERDARPQRP